MGSIRLIPRKLLPIDRQFDRDWGEYAQTQMTEILDSEGLQ